MKEVEVKARVKDEEKVLTELKKLGCVFSSPVKQIDTVYTKIIGNVEEYLKNDHFVRIREKSDGKHVFTVKMPKGSRESLVKTEHETEVKDGAELEQALFLMGYKIANKIIKVRRTTTWNDYEICLDAVEELGAFIEVEKMVADNSVDEKIILKELQDFLVSIGVSLDDEVKRGYDLLMLDKK
jgi:adenylate cyclase class 2